MSHNFKLSLAILLLIGQSTVDAQVASRRVVPPQAQEDGQKLRSSLMKSGVQSTPQAAPAPTLRRLPAADDVPASAPVQLVRHQETTPPAVNVEPEVIGAPAGVPQAVEVQPIAAGYFTLSELTDIANRQHPLLDRSQADVEAAMGERVQAGLYPNPRMETNNPEIWAGQQSYVNFGFQQDLVTKGKLRLDKAAADQLVRSESAGFSIDRAQMLTQLRTQYVDVMAAKQRVMLAKYITKVSSQSLQVAKELQQAGEGNLTDVLLLDSEYQRALAELDNAQSLLDGEFKQLAAVTGVPDMVVTDVEGSLFHIAPEFDENEIRNFVSSDSSFMERMRAEIIRSQTLLRRAEVEAYPNLRFGPSFQTGTQSGTAQFWLSVVFDIPVWDLNQGNIRKAKAKVQGSHADLAVVRAELIRQTAEKFSRYRAAKQVAERIQKSILPNSQNALSLVQDGFSKGQFDVNRLLQAQKNLSDVAREHIDASEKAWRGAAELSGLAQIEYFPIVAQPQAK